MVVRLGVLKCIVVFVDESWFGWCWLVVVYVVWLVDDLVCFVYELCV